MININKKLFFRYAFIAAIFIHVIAAIYSVGYYYADEHYQLVEFAGYKLGTHAPNELAWEFAYRLRPSFQPALCYCIIRTAQIAGIDDPFMQTLLLRLLSAGISLAAIVFFIKTFFEEFKSDRSQKMFIVLSFFLWFIPFTDVRFSSETWAGAFFITSICLLKKLQSGNWVLLKIFTTLIIACAVLVRYQMLMPLAFVAVWFLLSDRNRFAFITIGIGTILSFAIGLAVDKWFYGEWTLPLYNYAHMVITGSGPDFGSEPWYYYFIVICTKSALPIGLLLLISFIYFWLTSPKHLITCITLPFFLLHVLLPHKELRFLFPLVMLCPFVICYFIEKVQLQLNNANLILKKSFNALIIALMLLNFVLLTVVIFLPASPGIAIAETIHKSFAAEKAILIHTPYSNPYSPFESVPVKFYVEKNVQQIKVNNSSELPDSVLTLKTNLLFSLRSDDYEINKDYLNAKNFRLIKYAIPGELIKWNNDIWYSATDNFVLLQRIDVDEK
ncbi:MAG: hypothetical protein ABI723_02870 [Bacteroidia bacterium]